MGLPPEEASGSYLFHRLEARQKLGINLKSCSSPTGEDLSNVTILSPQSRAELNNRLERKRSISGVRVCACDLCVCVRVTSCCSCSP